MNQIGQVIVFTGNGKGKTSAALGIALRACGHQMRVSIVHFIKTPDISGEERAAHHLKPELEITMMGRGFVSIQGDALPIEQHRAAVEDAFRAAIQRVQSGYWDVVILDEINIVVHMGLLPVETVLQLIRSKPSKLHLILTGRDVHPDIVKSADMVTEMKEIKHPYKLGIPAQKGIDY